MNSLTKPGIAVVALTLFAGCSNKLPDITDKLGNPVKPVSQTTSPSSECTQYVNEGWQLARLLIPPQLQTSPEASTRIGLYLQDCSAIWGNQGYLVVPCKPASNEATIVYQPVGKHTLKKLLR